MSEKDTVSGKVSDCNDQYKAGVAYGRIAVLEELEAEVEKLVCVTNTWADEDGKEFTLETIDAAALRALIRAKKEGMK